MKPSIIYSWKPISVSKDLSVISHIIESEDISYYDMDRSQREKQKYVKLKYYIQENLDGIRVIEMFSVWFYDKPVMICQKAGRDGKDYSKRFITDQENYIEMLDYFRSMLPDFDPDHLVDPEDDFTELDSFYTCKASDLYDPKFKPKHRKDAIVTVHIPCQPKTKYKIVKVFPFNPTRTYIFENIKTGATVYGNDANVID